jgi:predicted metal-binding membrane protein
MGWFTPDVQTIAVNQAADRKATADIATSVPIWEMMILTAVIPTAIYVIWTCAKKVIKKKFEQEIIRATAQQV